MGRLGECYTGRRGEPGKVHRKIRYLSWQSARRAMVEMTTKEGRPFSAYQCQHCGAFHVGNMPAHMVRTIHARRMRAEWSDILGERATAHLMSENLGHARTRRKNIVGRCMTAARKSAKR